MMKKRTEAESLKWKDNGYTVGKGYEILAGSNVKTPWRVLVWD